MKATCHYRHCDIEFKLKPSQKSSVTRGHRVYCCPDHHTKEHLACLKDKRAEKNKHLPKIKTCNLKGCKNKFKPTVAWQNYCCYAHQVEANWKSAQKSKREYYRRNKKLYTKKDEPKTSGRKCKLCGKDPYPNYYFCPPCHRQLPENDSDNWHGISIGGK